MKKKFRCREIKMPKITLPENFFGNNEEPAITTRDFELLEWYKFREKRKIKTK